MDIALKNGLRPYRPTMWIDPGMTFMVSAAMECYARHLASDVSKHVFLKS